MRTSRLILWCIFASLFLIACNLLSQPNPGTPRPTEEAAPPQPSSQASATAPTSTASLAATNTAIPGSTDTAAPGPTSEPQTGAGIAISPENVARITRLASIPLSTFVTRIAWSPDSQWLALSSNNEIRFVDRSGSPDASRTIKVAEQPQVVSFSPDGNVLGITLINTDGSGQMKVTLWDLLANAPLTEWNQRLADATAVGFSPDENTVAAGKNDGTVALWNSHEKTLIKNLTGGSAQGVMEIKFSPDGKRLAAISANGELTIWDIDSGQAQVFTAMGWIAGPIAYPLLRPDWQELGWVDRGSVNVITLPDEQEHFQVNGRESTGGQTFSPDSRLLTFASYDNPTNDPNSPRPYLNFYDAASGQLIFRLESFTTKNGLDAIGDIPVNAAFSPDRTRLAIIFNDRIELWYLAGN